MVDPKPAAVGVAADYKTHADFLYLIMFLKSLPSHHSPQLLLPLIYVDRGDQWDGERPRGEQQR